MRTAWTLLVACVVMLVPGVASDHLQNDSGMRIAFDHKTGNEWWVEVILSGDSASTVSKVEARDTDGAWVNLPKRSWGAWGASFHIEPSNLVQFRATWPSGVVVTSCWFTHPSGVEQCPSAFDATFTLVKGNEWWVQSQVTPNSGHTVRAVDVRLNGGEWKPLKLQTWGVREWAASYHIPEGTVVQLRATDTMGATDLSSCYRWIPPQTGGQDASVTACAAPRFDATFSNVKGNDWWVETTVRANEPLAGVDARVGCAGAWKPLTLRSWGSWAASFYVPPGSTVDFRARSTGGATDGSGGYVWPHATPTSACPVVWPVPGSYANFRFRAEQTWSDVDGSHLVRTDGFAQFRFSADQQWVGTCEVRRDHKSAAGWNNVTETWAIEGGPPMADPATSIGQEEMPTTIENCAKVGYPSTVTDRQTRTFSVRTSSGDPVPIDAWRARNVAETYTWDFWWDARHGLMLSWDVEQPHPDAAYFSDGWLLDTDAQFAS